MGATAEAARVNLYADLLKFGQINDYERTLKIANKILHSNNDDLKAFQYRIISLIQLSRFDDALLALSKFPNLSKELQFEKAYALYRLNRIEESLQVLETVQNPEIKHIELKAQVYYRLERFEDCFDLYRQVIKQTSDEFDDERQTNLAAIVVNLVLGGKNMEMPEFECETYEIYYNIACYLMAKGSYAEAEKTLKNAEKICREYDEDAQDEMEDELNIIKLQQACCAHFQGRDREAMSTYTSILKKKPSDPALIAVASNNSIAINRDQNLFDSKKKMKNIMSEGVQPKLTLMQKRVIAMNHCLLNIFTNQGDQALSICDTLVKNYPEMEENAILMKASIIARENVQEAIKLLENYAQKNPKSQLKMKLAVVQFFLNNGNVTNAVKKLETLGDETFRPGIASAIVTMYLEMGSPQDASKILEKAVAWNQKNKTTVDLSALWRHAADLHLRNGKPEIAASSLEELLKINPNDVITLAQLIIAYAQFDPSKANKLSNKLPHLVDLTPNIDADKLESSSWIMGMKVMKKAAKVDPSPGTPLIKKSHSKRKKRLPKNYNPNVQPDPERWLPKHERSTFRKKKDRRNKDIGKGTQGTAAGASDQYDMSKHAGTSKFVQNTPSPPQDYARQQQRKVQQKKKKKTGKR